MNDGHGDGTMVAQGGMDSEDLRVVIAQGGKG